MKVLRNARAQLEQSRDPAEGIPSLHFEKVARNLMGPPHTADVGLVLDQCRRPFVLTCRCSDEVEALVSIEGDNLIIGLDFEHESHDLTRPYSPTALLLLRVLVGVEP